MTENIIPDPAYANLFIGLSERDARLVKRAAATLWGNILQSDEKLPWSPNRGIAPSPTTYRGVWNWDSAFHAITLSRYDPALAIEQARIIFTNQRGDGCLPDTWLEDGTVISRFSKPPVWFYACECIDRAVRDDVLLRSLYPRLCKCENFWRTRRFDSGLFHYDCDEGRTAVNVRYESGLDTSPRWDTDHPEQLFAIDLCCFMVSAYRSLAYMAGRLSLAEDAEKWTAREKSLTGEINGRMYDPDAGMYTDVSRVDGTFSHTYSPMSFLPLCLGFAPAEYAGKVAARAFDPQSFSPLMPSVEYSHPAYRQDNYWRGPTWLNLAYFAVRGLYNYGFGDGASALSERLLDMCDAETTSIYEYYDSRTGKGIGAPEYGWSAAFIIELIMLNKERKVNK